VIAIGTSSWTAFFAGAAPGDADVEAVAAAGRVAAQSG
jgi:hypothetical protein